MSAPLLAVTGASVRFGGVHALDDVSMAVAEGELVGLIGPNGAGKTTLLKVVTGIQRPDAGRVRLMDADVTRLPTHVRVRRGLGLTHQIVRPFRSMSVSDNVALAAGLARTRHPLTALLRTDRRREIAETMALLQRVGLGDVAGEATSALPLGYLKRLELARALALKPRIVLLDEPLAGLNAGEARGLADTIVELNGGGITVVLVEHNLGEVLRVCRRLVVLDGGAVIADGDPRNVMANPAVREAYLGSGGADAAA